MGILSRIFRPRAQKGVEGEYRPGPWPLALSGGVIPADWPMNYWQTGRDPVAFGRHSAMVEACISAYAQTVAMCPGDHWRRLPNGGRERVANSALTRVIRRPNDYQSMSDFLLNLTRSMYGSGNAYALALRNDRYEISELHLMDARRCSARIARDGSIFYDLGGNEIIDRRIDGPLLVPARDVLHVRLHTPRHPLQGETPLMAVALDEAASTAIMQQQLAFFLNQTRPGFVLTTDMTLTAEQVAEVRTRWNEQARGMNSGGTPILTGGLKPQTIATTAQDAQLAELLGMTSERVALAFRVPMQILGQGDTPFASTEALMQAWISTGLGFALNHIEEAFGLLFNLRGVPDEYVEFDTRALLRSAHKDRITALAEGVRGGIYSPNEARAEADLPPVEFGDQPRVQQQVVPLSYGAAMQPPAQAAATPTPVTDDKEPDEDAERSAPDAIFRRINDPASLLH